MHIRNGKVLNRHFCWHDQRQIPLRVELQRECGLPRGRRWHLDDAARHARQLHHRPKRSRDVLGLLAVQALFARRKVLIEDLVDPPSSNVTVQNETVGPTYESAACGGNAPNTNGLWGVSGPVLMKNVTFKDARRGCGGNQQHQENIYMANGNSNVTMDGVVFYNGPNSGEVTAPGSGPDSAELFITGTQTNFVLQNSYCYGVGNVCIDGASDSNFVNSRFRNNVFNLGVLMQHAYPSSFLITDNVYDTCPIGQNGSSGATIRHNLVYGGGAPCNATDTATSVNLPSIFTNPLAGDFTLKSGSPAIDVGGTTAGDYAVTDKAGASRYCGSAADAGPYERCP